MKVALSFFQDDANGEYGVCHTNAVDKNFNAFWTGAGIFHDVFEHYFEDIHPYFKNEYGFNIAGEVAAMGHMTWYGRTAARDVRLNTSNFEQAAVNGTIGNMMETMMFGYSTFGYEILSKVPYQGPPEHALEIVINDHQTQIKAVLEKPIRADDDNDFETAKIYRKSYSDKKIERLYVWGYKQAQRICPTYEHGDVLKKFIEYWDTFCQTYPAQYAANIFKEIEFTIIPGKNLKWNCVFIMHDNQRINHRFAGDHITI